jgi:decaprenylphosphoryl-5-phosphoribose phosphatase
MATVDRRLLLAMRTRAHAGAVERAAILLGKTGNNGAIWIAIGVLLALVDSSNRGAWLICAALGPIAIGVNYLVKLVVRRPRPVLEALPPLGGAPSSLSFPSAHATSSFAVATAMTRVEPVAAIAFLLAAALAFGRPYLGMHYPSDVLGGAILGVAIGLVVPLSL